MARVEMTGDGLRLWKKTCLDVAERLLDKGPPPVSTHKIDQALAAADEAGFTERDKGALIAYLVTAEVQNRSKFRTMPREKVLAIAMALTARLLAGQPEPTDRF